MLSKREIWLFQCAALAVAACGVRQAEPTQTASHGTASGVELEPVDWWKQERPCPFGAARKGAAGKAIWCEKPVEQAHGPRTEWFPNGKKSRELAFRNGLQEGRFLVYFEDGQVADEGRYRTGKLEGRRTKYYPTGQRESECEFRSGKEHGKCTRWDEEGQKTFEGEYRLGKPNGVVKDFHPSGGKREESEFMDGVQHGTYRTFHEDGSKETLGRYSKGQRIGIWETYRENGKKAEEVVYVAGVKEGKITRWHDNGFHELTGQYKADKKHGAWTYSDDEGAVERVESYEDDALVTKRGSKPGKAGKKPPKKRAPKQAAP